MNIRFNFLLQSNVLLIWVMVVSRCFKEGYNIFQRQLEIIRLEFDKDRKKTGKVRERRKWILKYQYDIHGPQEELFHNRVLYLFTDMRECHMISWHSTCHNPCSSPDITVTWWPQPIGRLPVCSQHSRDISSTDAGSGVYNTVSPCLSLCKL